jgi:alpha-galactosidase
MQAVYQKMGDALQASGRPIVYSLCQYGKEDVWKWGGKVGGNSWRTTGDIQDTWRSMSTIGFDQAKIAEYEAPGHWNDPDMLEVGNGGMTSDEYRVHMTLWSLLSSPLLAGNDLEKMSSDTKSILMNKDVIAINQDPAVHHPKRYEMDNGIEIWTRELQDGSTVAAVFNRSESAAKVPVDWAKIGITRVPEKGRNLWTHADVTLGTGYSASVPKHGVVLVKF